MIEEGLSRRHRRLRRGDLPVAEIARLAGVSAPTVSKVLNGRAGVGEQTRRRVETLLRDHGFRQPAAAQRVHGIEVVFRQMLGSITIEILRGVGQVVEERDLAVSFADLAGSPEAGQPWVESLLRRRPTGAITVFPGVTAEQCQRLSAGGVPVVALDPTGDLGPTPAVGSSSWGGVLAATRYLLEIGHRRIGAVAGPIGELATRSRMDGLRAALDNVGVPFDEHLVRHGTFSFEQGRDLGLELLRLPAPPTAVVCCDDLQALGVYEAARLTGMQIPDDLSVVGFDDVDQAGWASPPLTTVRQPFAEMGATAARLVLALADGEQLTQTHYELGTSLIVRGSTAPPRR